MIYLLLTFCRFNYLGQFTLTYQVKVTARSRYLPISRENRESQNQESPNRGGLALEVGLG